MRRYSEAMQCGLVRYEALQCGLVGVTVWSRYEALQCGTVWRRVTVWSS